jgi:fumarylacetoacetate (FAA) hydrolase family protein
VDDRESAEAAEAMAPPETGKAVTMMTAQDVLPADSSGALLVGRVFDPVTGGPRVGVVQGEDLVDITALVRTVSDAMEHPEKLADSVLPGATRYPLGHLLAASEAGDRTKPYFLAPIDLQVVKACGVTFVGSMIERVIEEKCAGDAAKAQQVREHITGAIGGSLKGIEPGSEKAQAVKDILIEQGVWSAYLEVGIGPDPEVFTKAPVLSSVGWGATVGIPGFSSWNNPEPELVLIVNSKGVAVGATLGNDVNLRDVEGRSALLLGKAKDNNASSALGPFIRVFDEQFTLDTVASEEIHLQVSGTDGYELHGVNSVAEISRPLESLVSATWGAHHQYPDGFALYTGTLFAPTQDRDTPGGGFTHKHGDRVEIRSEHLGALVNTTGPAEELEPWNFGLRAMMDYLGVSSTNVQ